MSANSPRLINIEGVEVGDKIRVITVVDGVQIIKTGVVGYIQNQNNVRTGSTIEGGTLFFYGPQFKKPTVYLVYRPPMEDTPILDIDEWIREHG